MSNANNDKNRVKTMIGETDDLSGITQVKADPSTHRVSATYLGTDGVSNSGIASRDDNHEPVLMAVSSVDGQTPVSLRVTSDGKLLI